MLLDSNIIIYSVQPENSRLRQFIAEQEPAVSALSYLEVLGYHQLTADDRLTSMNSLTLLESSRYRKQS